MYCVSPHDAISHHMNLLLVQPRTCRCCTCPTPTGTPSTWRAPRPPAGIPSAAGRAVDRSRWWIVHTTGFSLRWTGLVTVLSTQLVCDYGEQWTWPGDRSVHTHVFLLCRTVDPFGPLHQSCLKPLLQNRKVMFCWIHDVIDSTYLLQDPWERAGYWGDYRKRDTPSWLLRPCKMTNTFLEKDGVAPLITDPPPTNYTIFLKKKKQLK